MKIIEKIDRKEVLRLWAIGEINSEHLSLTYSTNTSYCYTY